MCLEELAQLGLGRREERRRGRLRAGQRLVVARCGRELLEHRLEVVVVRAQDDLVVDVGDVHHVEDVEAKVVEQHAADDVERHIVARVAHVR